jgi:hypothetical protein
VPLGPAVAAQVESVLMQLCGSSRRVADPEEFLELAAPRAALLFSVRMSAALSASVLNSATSTGFASGDVLVTGPNGAEGVRYLIEGKGSFENDAYKAVDGAEGLREALRRAFQSLLDQAVHDRQRLIDLAEPLSPPTP